MQSSASMYAKAYVASELDHMGKWTFDSLFANLCKHQPAVIPAASASRVTDYLPLSLIQTLGAERIILCQRTKLAEQIVRVDVVGPGIGHGLSGVVRIGSGKYLLDSTKFREGIDLVCLERADQLRFLVLKTKELVMICSSTWVGTVQKALTLRRLDLVNGKSSCIQEWNVHLTGDDTKMTEGEK